MQCKINCLLNFSVIFPHLPKQIRRKKEKDKKNTFFCDLPSKKKKEERKEVKKRKRFNKQTFSFQIENPKTDDGIHKIINNVNYLAIVSYIYMTTHLLTGKEMCSL